MTQQERSDITRLYEQTPHGVLFTLVEVRGASYPPPGARIYATVDARRAGSILHAELHTVSMKAGEGARIHSLGDADVLMEHSSTPEAAALMEACVAALAGELRVVATLLPEGETSLLRFVMDERGDVLFASELLETEDIVPLRRFARLSAHGAIHVSSQGRLFVERMEAAVTEERILQNDIPQVVAE